MAKKSYKYKMSEEEAGRLLDKALNLLEVARLNENENEIKKYKKDIKIIVNMRKGIKNIPRKLQKQVTEVLNS